MQSLNHNIRKLLNTGLLFISGLFLFPAFFLFPLNTCGQTTHSIDFNDPNNFNLQLDSAQYYLNQKKYSISLDMAVAVYTNLKQKLKIDSSLYSRAALILGRSYLNLKDYLQAQLVLKELINQYDSGLEPIDRIMTHYALMLCYEALESPSLAKQELQLCYSALLLADFENSHLFPASETKIHLHSLRTIARKARDRYQNYELALSIFEKSLLLYAKSGSLELGTYTHIIIDMGYSYFLLRNYPKALEHYDVAASYIKSRDSTNLNSEAYLSSMYGKYYLHQRDFQKAAYYFEKGISIMSRPDNKDIRDLPFYHINYGIYCDSVKEYTKALECFDRALTLFKKSDGSESEMDANLQLYKGRAFLGLRQYQLAIASFEADQRILIKLHDSSYHKLFNSNEGLGEAYYQSGLEKNTDHCFSLSLINYQKGFQVIKNFVATSQDLTLKKSMLIKANPYCIKYLKLLDALISIHGTQSEYFDMAWDVSEFMHNSLLLLNLIETREHNRNSIPDSVLLAKEQLQLRINEKSHLWKEQLRKKQVLFTDTLSLLQKNNIDLLKDSLRQISSKFIDKSDEKLSLSDLAAVPVNSLQSVLNDQQSLVEYFSTDSNVYLFVINKDRVYFKSIPTYKSVKLLISQYSDGIYSYFMNKPGIGTKLETSLNNYIQTATSLYAYLIRPIKQFCKEELIIIPDAVLGNLSFEALLSQSPSNKSNYQTYDFLVKHYKVSYNFSATAMVKMFHHNHVTKANKNLLAFAPFNDSNSMATTRQDSIPLRYGWAALPYSGEEIKNISNLFPGSAHVYYGTDATKDIFLGEASEFRILHLATHAKANFEEGALSYLAFQNIHAEQNVELMFAADFQNIRLKADLVALSACETAIGEFNRGNGMISLSSAIASAGAKSILASLWKVNDKSTMQIMNSFYKEMVSGKPKNQALQLAKKNYLSKNKASLGHPFYWSGFLLYGDLNPVLN